MRKMWMLAMLMVAAGAMHAERLAGGVEFRTPSGWTAKVAGDAALLMPPDMVMEPGGKDPSELYIVALMPGIRNLQDPQLLSILQAKFFPKDANARMVGAAQPFQAAGGPGYAYRYDAVSQGIALRMQLYVVGLQGGGVAGLVAVARPGLLMMRGTAIANVAVSLNRQGAAVPAPATAAPAPAPVTSALAAQWDQKLRGHKLYQFSGYSSSYGSGGMSSEKTILLRADGSYEFHRASSTSIYASGATGGAVSQNGAQGRWRIYEQGDRAILELAPSGGATETIVLTTNGGKTLLNGNRWLVGN